MDNFEIADTGLSKNTQNAINVSLDRIQKMVDNFVPITQTQDFGLLYLSTFFGSTINVGIKPVTDTAIYGTNSNYSSPIYIGTLHTNGFLECSYYGYATVYQYIRV